VASSCTSASDNTRSWPTCRGAGGRARSLRPAREVRRRRRQRHGRTARGGCGWRAAGRPSWLPSGPSQVCGPAGSVVPGQPVGARWTLGRRTRSWRPPSPGLRPLVGHATKPGRLGCPSRPSRPWSSELAVVVRALTDGQRGMHALSASVWLGAEAVRAGVAPGTSWLGSGARPLAATQRPRAGRVLGQAVAAEAPRAQELWDGRDRRTSGRPCPRGGPCRGTSPASLRRVLASRVEMNAEGERLPERQESTYHLGKQIG
jgi:hypothetical protein